MVTNEPDVEYTEVVHHRMSDPTRGKHTHIYIVWSPSPRVSFDYYILNLI